jgi:hypothetical protein
LVVTIPILLLAWGIYFLLNKWQLRYQPPTLVLNVPAGPPKSQPLHWPTLLFGTLRFILFGIALPLATIHLWILVAGREARTLFEGGAESFFKRVGNAMSNAFASESVLIYALGLIFFALVPYLLLFVPVTVKGNKTDFTIFILRLVLSFVFTLIGWVVTLSTLAKRTIEASSVVASKPIPAAPAEAAA